MLIGNRQSESKLYRGIKYYNGLPLTSEDRHEDSDLVAKKTALFTNNLVGNGTLNEPDCIISSSGVSLSEPSVVLIDGDVSLIQTDEGFPMASMSDITLAGHEDGILCILGWYQHLDHSSTIKSYGGVMNSTLENDLTDPRFGGIQVSTRYQFRWATTLIDYNVFTSGEPFSVQYFARSEDGVLLNPSVREVIEVPGNNDRVKVSTIPPSMSSYAVSDLYIVPIFRYRLSDGVITYASSHRSIKPIPSPEILKSSTEPTGEFREGTYWYNPDTGTYQVYISDRFASTTNSLSLRQYTNTVVLEGEITTPSDIEVDIGISQYLPSDILRVIYEGVELIEGENYSLDNTGNKITLSSFTTRAGDKVTFIVNKLVSV